MKNIGEILLEKLTSEELAALCNAYDDGSIETIFTDILLPKDVENRPEEYASLDEDVRDASEDEEELK